MLLALTRHLTRDVCRHSLAVDSAPGGVSDHLHRGFQHYAPAVSARAHALRRRGAAAVRSLHRLDFLAGAVNDGLPLAAQIGLFCGVLAGTLPFVQRGPCALAAAAPST